MWILVIINGIGLLSGLLSQKLAMYILFAISFLFFSHRYAIVSWKIIYEERVLPIGEMDARVANEFVCFFVMACIFWEMVHKLGLWCGIIPIIQCIIFHILDYLQKKPNAKLEILVCYIAELLVCVALCLG